MPYNQVNFQKMLQIIDDVFATRKDENQLQVNEQVIKKLAQMHPATLTELADENGPTTWVLMIPTTAETMNDFILGKITEKEILEQTEPGQIYTCIYLCSATTLPEFRGKGTTKRLCMEAIQAISKQHPIKTLYVWPFTEEGNALAMSIAKTLSLALVKVGH